MNTSILALVQLTLGTATFYSDWYQGRRTANGERFNQGALTAAHMSLPFGTCVKVKNISNKKTVNVRINDRGAFNSNWIDLSKRAFDQIGDLRSGRLRVQLRVLERNLCK